MNIKQNYHIYYIGICNSKGIIYNFWGKYKKESVFENIIWEKVINISLDVAMKNEEFDKILDEDFENQKKTHGWYHPIENNCYSYVCRFFNHINYSYCQWSKESLAVNVIEPKMQYLTKYVYILQRLISEDKGVFIENVEKGKITYYLCDKCEKSLMGVRMRCVICEDFDLCLDCYNKYKHEHEMKII